eukprot:470768-Amphidinium_carterae.1
MQQEGEPASQRHLAGSTSHSRGTCRLWFGPEETTHHVNFARIDQKNIEQTYLKSCTRQMEQELSFPKLTQLTPTAPLRHKVRKKEQRLLC